MQLARVVGTVVAPVQHPFYDGRKLLLVRPRTPEDQDAGEGAMVAVDLAGAGVGDLVLVLKEGSSARALVDDARAPVRTVVVGVVDEVEVRGRRIDPHRATG